MLKKQIKIKLTKEDKPIKVFIKPETYDVMRKLRVIRAAEYHNLIKQGVATRSAMLDLLKKEGYWTDREETMMNDVIVRISLLEQLLDTEQDEVKQRDTVLDLMKFRGKLLQLIQIKTEPLESVAETIAEDIERENYIVESTFYEDGKKYFAGYEDFKLRRNDDDVIKICSMFVKALNLDNSNALLELPEHKWLIDKKLMNKDGDLLDQELIEQLNEAKEEVVKPEEVNQVNA